LLQGKRMLQLKMMLLQRVDVPSLSINAGWPF
jgi:hypothetical protein